jgi:hypothetical protein
LKHGILLISYSNIKFEDIEINFGFKKYNLIYIFLSNRIALTHFTLVDIYLWFFLVEPSRLCPSVRKFSSPDLVFKIPPEKAMANARRKVDGRMVNGRTSMPSRAEKLFGRCPSEILPETVVGYHCKKGRPLSVQMQASNQCMIFGATICTLISWPSSMSSGFNLHLSKLPQTKAKPINRNITIYG